LYKHSNICASEDYGAYTALRTIYEAKLINLKAEILEQKEDPSSHYPEIYGAGGVVFEGDDINPSSLGHQIPGIMRHLVPNPDHVAAPAHLGLHAGYFAPTVLYSTLKTLYDLQRLPTTPAMKPLLAHMFAAGAAPGQEALARRLAREIFICHMEPIFPGTLLRTLYHVDRLLTF